MKRATFLTTSLAAIATSGVVAEAAPLTPSLRERLATTAESSSYTATALSPEIATFLQTLDKRGAPIVRGTLAHTSSGNVVPYVIASRPIVATPEAARKLGRPVILLAAGLRGSEVDGKEALLALLRDLCLSTQATFLDDLVLVFLPLVNPDGNDRLGAQVINAPMQDGPDLVGVVENADGVDLASDATRLAAIESRELLRFVRAWDPHAVIEVRTSDGSFHDYGVTYMSALHPAAEAAQSLARTRVLPHLRADVRRKFAIEAFGSGHFGRDRALYAPPAPSDVADYGWFARDARAGMLTNYLGICGIATIRIESYAHDPFARRVFNARAGVESVLSFYAENTDAVIANVAMLRRQSASSIPIRGALPMIATRREPVTWENLAVTSANAREPGMPVGLKRTGTFETAMMPMFDRYAATATIERPRGYLVEAAYAAAVWSRLHDHGIDSVVLEVPKPCKTSAFLVASRTGSRDRGNVEVLGQWSPTDDDRGGAIGELYVPSNQPLGVLASVLLEPQSEDSLIVFGSFTDGLRIGDTFPIRRVVYQ